MKLYISVFLLLAFNLLGFSQNKPKKPVGQLSVKEGKNAVYVFVSNQNISRNTPLGSLTGVKISRAVGDEKIFKPLGVVEAAQTLEDFKKIAGEGLIKDIMSLKKLKNEKETWDYIKAHPQIKDYGILVLSPSLIVALGGCYQDIEAKKFPKNTVVRYKAEYSTLENRNNGEVEGRIIIGTPPIIQKPVLSKISESDSTIIVSWTLDAETSPDAILAEVWMQEKANTPFQRIGSSFANKDKTQKLITYQWKQITKPRTAYNFYIIPTNLLGLQGIKSDTIATIARNFRLLPQIPIASIKDTTDGIYLSWQALKDTQFFSGIVIERSKKPVGGYAAIDTISASSIDYLDTRILPNTLYHYRFRMLSIRQTLSEPSAYVSINQKFRFRKPEAPETVKITEQKNGNILLSWTKVNLPEITGYQVFRTTQGNENYQLISNILQDSTFTDTTVHNSRLTYKYALKAMNYENQVSDFSAPVFGRPQGTLLPKTPYDIESYTEPGKNTLRWKDMIAYDDAIRGYNIYKRSISFTEKPIETELSVAELERQGFKKVNKLPQTEVIISDKDVTNGLSYAYAITAIDAFGMESKANGTKHILTPTLSLKAPNINARATSKGIEITWDDVLLAGAEKYLVFRRAANEAIPKQIGSVDLQKGVFIDAQVSSGNLYFYSIKVSGRGLTSDFSLEKNVRK